VDDACLSTRDYQSGEFNRRSFGKCLFIPSFALGCNVLALIRDGLDQCYQVAGGPGSTLKCSAGTVGVGAVRSEEYWDSKFEIVCGAPPEGWVEIYLANRRGADGGSDVEQHSKKRGDVGERFARWMDLVDRVWKQSPVYM
jgi:hypothetical protein